MGKSDIFVFNEYKKILESIEKPRSIAFLGFSTENQFTKTFNAEKHFYDIQLGNWEINSDWSLPQKYDLIVCTRCAYFCKNPHEFIVKCKKYLTEEGYAFIDWGLGDHWRYQNFKVGWVRNGEHEKAYFDDNFLYSCFWSKDLEEDSEVKKFWKAVKLNNFNYSNNNTLSEVIEEEVPVVVEYPTKLIKTLFLWPESPQLYIATLI